jgi:hypothetical protein
MREKRTRWQGVLRAHNFGMRSGRLRSHEMIGVLLLCWLLGPVPLAIGVGRSIAWGQGRCSTVPSSVAPASLMGCLVTWIRWQEPWRRSRSTAILLR